MTSLPPPELPPALITRLRNARSIAVLTGAGVSAESGVPTFRDAQSGLWAKFDPLELATPDAFRRNPRLVWDWYAWRRTLIGAAQPNAGHHALASWESHCPQFLLITQNVDGLHQAAGSASTVELHGNLRRVKCSREGTPTTEWEDTNPEEPPRCRQCGAFLRPDVVWFQEDLPRVALARAIHGAHTCDAMLVVGTSAEVHPAAALPRYARAHDAPIIEVNPAATALSGLADFVLRGPSGVVLPALLAAVWPEASVSP